MECEEFRETVLDIAVDAAERQRIGDSLRHVQNCEQCRLVLSDFDEMNAVLKLGSEPILPPGGWDAFNVRLMQTITPSVSTVPDRFSSHRFWIGSIARCAAAACLITFAFLVGRHAGASRPDRSGLTDIPTDSLERLFGLDYAGVASDVKAFATVSQQFGGEPQWILATDTTHPITAQKVEFVSAPQAMDRPVDVLRLTMLKGQKIVSSVDLVIVPGQSADLNVALPAGASVHYRAGTWAGDDRRLDLLAEIESGDGMRSSATLATTLRVQPDGQISAGEMQTPTGRYELHAALIQTALPMK